MKTPSMPRDGRPVRFQGAVPRRASRSSATTRPPVDERGSALSAALRMSLLNRPRPGATTRPPVAERGSALAAVMLVSLLIGAAAIGSWSALHWQARATWRRAARARAATAARSALALAADWFEQEESGSVVPSPSAAEADFDRREVDLDGDGFGTPWASASPPSSRRYRDGADPLFRPPDGPGAADRFLGTPRGPDLTFVRPAAAATLDALSRVVAPGGEVRVEEVSFRRPAAGAPEGALTTIRAVAVIDALAGLPVRVAAEGTVLALDWGRPDLLLRTGGDMEVRGPFAWERGEVRVGGDLSLPAGAWDGFPGSGAWAGADRPLRRDNDGDGTVDDRDGDGGADEEQWRALPQPVPDPWWRLRVAGGWNGPAALTAPPCGAPFPFALWRTPPAPLTRADEHSAIWLECPEAAPRPLVAPELAAVARAGRRGLALYLEDAADPDLFRLDGFGPAQPAGDLVPGAGGAVLLVTQTTAPLDLRVGEARGAILVTGPRRLRVRAGLASARPLDPPPPFADTGGEDRPAAADDPALAYGRSGLGCDGWRPGSWGPQSSLPTPTPGSCGGAGLHLDGLLASEGPAELIGPWRQRGTIRAGSLSIDASAGEVRLTGTGRATPESRRPGPPGAPRVAVVAVRIPE